MIVDVDQLRHGETDCAEDIHDGTWKPRPAEVLVDGRPLCLHHHLAALPIVELAP